MARAKRPGRDRSGPRERARRADGASLPDPQTEPSKPLLTPGGRVDKAAVYRAAQSASAPKAATPSPGEGGLGESDADVVPRAEGAGAESDEEATAPRVAFRLTRDLDKRLDKYLTDRISFMSRAQLQRLIEDGAVLVNGRQAKPSTNLRLGDLVEVFVPPPRAEGIVPEDIPLAVMFEDEHLVVVNKTPDIMVHPARSHLSGTMVNALAYHFKHRSASGGALSEVGQAEARPGVIHRLDRQTSGVIVFAKTERAHWQVSRQFMDRTVEKRYLAVVHGLVEPRIDVIDVPLGPHPSREKGYREKQVVRHDHLGKPALTVARVLGHYWDERAGGTGAGVGLGGVRPSGGAREDAFSLVEVELKTGRTHQIRVHLSHRGFPLVGDDLYGGKASAGGTAPGLARVALHAALLEFRHPIDGRPMRFEAPLPADLARLVGRLRGMARVEEFEGVPGAVHSPGAIGREAQGDLLR